MNIYTWILLALFCAVAIPVIWTSVNRCPKCHGFCEDEEECRRKQNMNGSIVRYERSTKEAHEQKENNDPAA